MNELDDELINFDDYPNLDLDNHDEPDLFLNENDNNNQHIDDDPFIQSNENDGNELIKLLLNDLGISDPNKIQIEDENGEISDVNFNDLSNEEQLFILNQTKDDSSILDDSEIETINYLRNNNLSLEDLINFQREDAIREYLESQNTFEVDNLSNEELYKLDLKSQFDSLSDEELDNELQKELNNPDIFNKKIEKIRELYKNKEIQEKSDLDNRLKLENEENYNNSVNMMVEIAQNTNELFDLELEDNDKEEVLQFLLSQDVNGQSEFVKMLNDPQQLFNLAWFALKGKEAFDTVHDYYKKEIDSVRKANKGTNLTSRTTVVKKDTKQGKDDPYELENYLT